MNSLPVFARHAPHRACRGNRVPAPLSSTCSCKDVCVAKTAEQRRRFLPFRPMSGVVVKTARHKCISAAFNLRCQAKGHDHRSEEHTSELQSLMRISYAVFCLKKKNTTKNTTIWHTQALKRQPTNQRHK